MLRLASLAEHVGCFCFRFESPKGLPPSATPDLEETLTLRSPTLTGIGWGPGPGLFQLVRTRGLTLIL